MFNTSHATSYGGTPQARSFVPICNTTKCGLSLSMAIVSSLYRPSHSDAPLTPDRNTPSIWSDTRKLLATSEGLRYVPSGRPCWPARWSARPATKLCSMIIPRDISAPQLRIAVCRWIKELIGRVSAREKWRLKEMMVDFWRADLRCVQWCQISLGKGAGVDHFWSKRLLLQIPLYPIGEVFPKRISHLPC